MKTATIGALALLFLAIPSSPDEKKSFRELQWKYPRVRTAAKEKNEVLGKWFREKGVAFSAARYSAPSLQERGPAGAMGHGRREKRLRPRARISNLHFIG